MPPIAAMIAQYFEGWCAVSFMDAETEPRRIALAHFDPEKREAAQKLLAVPPKRNLPQKMVTSIDLRQPTILNAIDDHFIDVSSRDAEHAALVRQLGLGSMIVAPMVARDKLIGALSIMSAKQGHFEAADADLANLIARRAAVAIDNAQLYRAAVEASNAKDEFLATVSHELRTPMTATLGWAMMLRMNSLPPESFRMAIETIERSTKAQARLIDEILDVSYVATGKLQLTLAPLSIRAVIEAACSAIRPTIEAKELSLQLAFAPLSGTPLGDAGRLQQVFWNLLTNAVKFTPGGGSITIAVDEPSRGTVRVVMRDSGQGIPKRFLPFVFERFRQADGSTTRQHGGLGLGLAIVKNIIELHNGTVTAASDGDGQGAAFTIHLPLVAAEPGDSQATQRNSAARPLADVLLVEEEKTRAR
jgi:signal transduction histidine kinase